MKLKNWDGLNQNREDIIRKFNGTYVHAIVPELKDEKPRTYYLGDFEDRNVGIRWVEKGKRNHGSVPWQSIDVLYSQPPHLGAVPYELGILFVSRLPTRQWQVGICRGTTALHDSEGVSVPLNLENVDALFSPQYDKRPVTELANELKRNKDLKAVALSPRFWLSKTKGNYVELHSNRIPVGTFQYGGFMLNAVCGDLKQELWDYLKLKV